MAQSYNIHVPKYLFGHPPNSTDHALTEGIHMDLSLRRNIDRFLAALCIFCTVVGVPGNLLALMHFIDQARSMARSSVSNRRGGAFFNDIYMVIAVCDLLICSSLFAQSEGYFSDRDPILFSNPIFCSVWGGLWEILPYYSVFLVGCLSISRLVSLCFPLHIFNRKVTVGVFTGYLLQHVLTRAIPIIIDNGQFKYGADVNYCYLAVNNWKFLSIACAIQMALPILPIFVCCVLSIVKLRSMSQLNSASTKRQQGATLTVILFTLIYIIYNIPIFVNYAHFMECWLRDDLSYLEQFNTPALYWYSWNCTFIICIALNSTSNPFLYFCRMSTFKRYVLLQKEQLSVSDRGTYKQLSVLAVRAGESFKLVSVSKSKASSVARDTVARDMCKITETNL